MKLMNRSFCILLGLVLALAALPARAQLAIPAQVAPAAATGTPGATVPVNTADDPYRAILAEFSVTSDAKGIGNYLKSLHPTSDTQKTIAKYIAQLSDDEFVVREGAMKQLLRMPTIPLEQLEKAKNGSDPEATWRAKEILAQGSKKHAIILNGALRTITRKQLKGLAKDVLATYPLCAADESLVHAASDALAATATPDDAELLRTADKDANLEIRVAAAVALGTALGERGVDDMKRLTASNEERVCAAAARALALLGDRASLEVFGKLLSAKDINVRVAAVKSLKAMTGEKLPYFAWVDLGKPEEVALQKKQIEDWLAWIHDKGPTAKLLALNTKPLELGRTLVGFFHEAKVVEYGPDGKQTWQMTGILQPWGVQGLPNGHRLVAGWGTQQVIEYDETGKEIWKRDRLPGNPFSVERLENGNTLVSLADASKIIEITPDGKETGAITVAGRPTDAHRLPDGTTLIALQQQNKVVEVDASGKEVWSKAGCSAPTSVHRLENGNTLVTEQGSSRVAEYDRSGKEVWKFDIGAPFDAQRLDNGNTIIAHQQGVTEIDREGKEVWRQPGNLCIRISRY